MAVAVAGIGIGIGIVALVLVLMQRSDDSPESKPGPATTGPCETGTRWQQKFSPYADGALIGVTELPEVAIIRGGARVGFPSAKEFAAMGFTSYVPVSAEDYTAIDLAPRDGLLFQERAFEDGPGRFYFSAGGAVYLVSDREALRAFGIDVENPIEIPSHGFDGAPRVPKTGTLLKLDGRRQIWIVDGGARRPITNACGNARINVLPNDSRALDEVPVRLVHRRSAIE